MDVSFHYLNLNMFPSLGAVHTSGGGNAAVKFISVPALPTPSSSESAVQFFLCVPDRQAIPVEMLATFLMPTPTTSLFLCPTPPVLQGVKQPPQHVLDKQPLAKMQMGNVWPASQNPSRPASCIVPTHRIATVSRPATANTAVAARALNSQSTTAFGIGQTNVVLVPINSNASAQLSSIHNSAGPTVSDITSASSSSVRYNIVVNKGKNGLNATLSTNISAAVPSAIKHNPSSHAVPNELPSSSNCYVQLSSIPQSTGSNLTLDRLVNSSTTHRSETSASMVGNHTVPSSASIREVPQKLVNNHSFETQKGEEQLSSSHERNAEVEKMRFTEKRAAVLQLQEEKELKVKKILPKRTEPPAANTRLHAEVASLRAEVATLKALLLQHDPCPVPLTAVTVDSSNSESLLKVVNVGSEVLDTELESITVKVEPIDWRQEPQACSSDVFSDLTLKRETDAACAEAPSGHAEAKDQSKEHSNANPPILEHPAEALSVKNEASDVELENIAVKVEPLDWHEESQVTSSGVSELTFKNEKDEVCAEARSAHATAEDKLREPSSRACDTNTIHLKSASQGSADSLPSDVSGKSNGAEIRSQDTHLPQVLLCKHCTFSSVQKQKLKLHLLDDHKLGFYAKCKYCDFTSIYPGVMKRHVMLDHGKSKSPTYQSNDSQCTAKKLSKQNRVKKRRTEAMIKCEMCSYTFTTEAYLERHLRNKHNVSEGVNLRLCSPARYKALKQRKARYRKGLKCKLCDYSCATKMTLALHKADKHGIGKLFSCNLCDFSAVHNSFLVQHLVKMHNLEMQFKCELCNFASASESAFQRHKKRTHDVSKLRISQRRKC